MRDELRESKMDIASIADCQSKILSLKSQKRKVSHHAKFPKEDDVKLEDFTPFKKKLIDGEPEVTFELSVKH
jgi:hypothetical protein